MSVHWPVPAAPDVGSVFSCLLQMVSDACWKKYDRGEALDKGGYPCQFDCQL